MHVAKVFFASCFCLLLTGNCLAQRKWEIVTYPSTSLPDDPDGFVQTCIRAIHCFNSNNCIAVGNTYTSPSVKSGKWPFNSDLILRTTDGGNSWQAQTSPRKSYIGDLMGFNAVYVIDSSSAFIVGDSGTILRTTTAGTTWETLESKTKLKLANLDFYDTQFGIVSGAGIILITTDRGVTWTAHDSLFPQMFETCKAVSPSTYYAIGHYGSMLRTKNRGALWDTTNVFTESGTSIRASVSIDSLHFVAFGSHKKIQGVFNSDSYITETTDGGITWSVLYDQAPDLYSHLNDGFFADKNHGVAVGSTRNQRFLLTEDGGKSWYSDSIALAIDPISMLSVAMPSSNKIFIAGTVGKASGYLLQWRGEYLNAPASETVIEESIQVTPNPARSYITIFVPSSSRSLIIHDVFGREIAHIPIMREYVEYDCSGLATGSYFLRAISEAGDILTTRFIKQ